MSETLIQVDDLSKKFCRSLKKSLWYGIQDIGSEITGRRHGHYGKLRDQEFWAVKNISFELKRGECLGLIGHNGAGKTTLLRMLNGLIKPDGGSITMRGKVGALIALGAGFNPILTGRENIYVNASVLGLTKKDIDNKLDEVIDFAEIEEFIDAPVQTYSSGMQVRLGFAIAAVLIEPDILFLDEVLAVGDIGFVIKCLNVVRKMTQNASVVFVSHNMRFISSFCTRVIMMEKGKVLLDTNNIGYAIEKYYMMIRNDEETTGIGGSKVNNIYINIDGLTVNGESAVIPFNVDAEVTLNFSIEENIKQANVILYIHNESMSPIICYPIRNSNNEMTEFRAGNHNINIPIGKIDLNAGRYSFVVTIQDGKSLMTLSRTQGLCPFTVTNDKKYWGNLLRPITIK